MKNRKPKLSKQKLMSSKIRLINKENPKKRGFSKKFYTEYSDGLLVSDLVFKFEEKKALENIRYDLMKGNIEIYE